MFSHNKNILATEQCDNRIPIEVAFLKQLEEGIIIIIAAN